MQYIIHRSGAVTFYSLQRLVFPNSVFNASEELYVRIIDSADVAYPRNEFLNIKESGRVIFDTFYNAFSVYPWKSRTEIEDLYLKLSGSGKFFIKIFHLSLGNPLKLVEERIINLDQNDDFLYCIEGWKNFKKGIVYFELICLDKEGGVISSGEWGTSTPPKRVPKLGIVITHYNRRQYLLPVISRIKSTLLADGNYADKINLVVVDNSRNIKKEEATGITLLPNKNYGGSGGFMRGLLYLQHNDFTHCLFMDDDASCEIESIKRTYWLLAYAKEENMAIAGAYMKDSAPSVLFEKGAKFKGICKPLKCGLDMRYMHDILLAEIEDVTLDYGGWWFFGFKLSYVKHYAFPFFVRGDDVMFAMSNQFDIMAIIGINSWGEGFGEKSDPFNRYLDARSHIIQAINNFKISFVSLYIIIAKFFLSAIFSYNYTTARAVLKAVNDVSKGPNFWLENMDITAIKKDFSRFPQFEIMREIERKNFDMEYQTPYESLLCKAVRVISLNGFLLPSIFLKNKAVFQHKTFRASFREIFGYKKSVI